ncbi:glycosyl transferase [Bacteroidia bacterium]|nr:glycosyl transferase [Bacteroidia bacterium]
MKKKRLYIFNGSSRAAEYGIGTYVNQLIRVLKDSDWEFHVVYLYAQGKEVEIVEKDGYTQIAIPFPYAQVKNANQYYARNIAYLLKELIPENKEMKTVFHLNFMTNDVLVKSLKKHFHYKIILVAHYTNWSFSLFGDHTQLKTLLEKTKLKDVREKTIVKEFKEDVRMINKVDQFVCVAQHTYTIFQKLGGVQATKTEIINNALADDYNPLSNQEKCLLRKKYAIEENTKVIIFAGRLDDVKGLGDLITAFKKLLTLYPNTRLIIVGEGNFNAWLKEASDSWSKITFTGRIDKKKLYEFYSLADIGVTCSLHEEFGFVAIEMMMHELPLIVTKTSGLNEIVEDKISGLKVPVRTLKGKRQVDVKSLTEKMAFLLENPASAKELGENGRKRFLEKYHLSLFKEKMINLYNHI